MGASSPGPALGIVELSSIARGVVVADALVKRAPSVLLMSRPVSSGKHLVMLHGGVAEVGESMIVAVEIAAAATVDTLENPMLAEPVWALLNEPVDGAGWSDDSEAESVAIIETTTVCAAIAAADAAVKVADVVLRDARLAVGIGGKAFFTMTGPLTSIEASADVARAAAGDRLAGLEIIASPAGDIRGHLIF